MTSPESVPVITGTAAIQLTDAELLKLVAGLDERSDDDGPGPERDAA